MRFMSFNIWGDYFGNPCHERDMAIADVVKRYQPDLLALQEVTANWWKSRLFTELADVYEVLRLDENGQTNYTPLLYRKDTLQAVCAGRELYHVKLDCSKGLTWGVFQTQNGKRLASFSTHYWWKGQEESNVIRTMNSMMLVQRLQSIRGLFGTGAIGGGDFNCHIASDPLNYLKQHGFDSAQETAPEASPVSSHHGDPVRGADNRYHGQPKPADNTPAFSIDHIMVERGCFELERETVVLDQDALDASDHSPIFVDFSVC